MVSQTGPQICAAPNQGLRFAESAALGGGDADSVITMASSRCEAARNEKLTTRSALRDAGLELGRHVRRMSLRMRRGVPAQAIRAAQAAIAAEQAVPRAQQHPAGTLPAWRAEARIEDELRHCAREQMQTPAQRQVVLARKEQCVAHQVVLPVRRVQRPAAAEAAHAALADRMQHLCRWNAKQLVAMRARAHTPFDVDIL